MTQIPWLSLLLKADPTYYGRDYSQPVTYAFSGGRTFRATKSVIPTLTWTADNDLITADDTYHTADLTGP